MDSVFEQFRGEAWPFKYHVQLTVPVIAGGVPVNKNVAEGWLRTKLGEQSDDVIRDQVAKVMAEMGVSVEEATEAVNDKRHLNSFKRELKREDEEGNPLPPRGFYVEGRQVKAMLKEAVNVAVAADKLVSRGWGTTNKGIQSFVAEHVVVDDTVVFLGPEGARVYEASETVQRFVHTWRGTGIQYEDVVNDAVLEFTVLTDWEISERDWAMIFLTGEEQGIGASRSQSYGKFRVTGFKQIPTGPGGALVTGGTSVAYLANRKAKAAVKVPAAPKVPAQRKPAAVKAATNGKVSANA
jgi:hypothetical protein